MIAKFSVKKPYTVLVGVVLVIVLGIVSFTKMTTDLLPNISLPYVIVMTTYPGASPETVEMAVTKPVEAGMATVSNIESISSVSSENYSMVILEFAQSTDMNAVSLEIRESLDQIKSYWDDTVGNPVIMKLNPDMLPVMVAAAGVEGMNNAQVSSYVENEVVPDLESLEGVASVSTTGILEESVNVIIRQEKVDQINKKIFAAIDEQMAEAEKEIIDGKQQILDSKKEMAEGKKELAEGELELVKGKAELLEGKAQLEEQQETTKATLAETKRDLLTAKADLESAKMTLTTNLTTAGTVNASINEMEVILGSAEAYKNAYNGMMEATVTSGDAVAAGTYRQSIVNLKDSLMGSTILMQATESSEELKNILAELNRLDWTDSSQYDTVQGHLDTMVSQLEMPLGIQSLKMMAVLNGLTTGLELEAYQQIAAATLQTLEEQLTAVNAGLVEVEKGELTAAIEFANAYTQIQMGELQMEFAQSQLDSAKVQLESGEEQLTGAEEQLTEGEEQLADAKKTAYEQADMVEVLTVDTIKGLLAAQNFSMPAGYLTEDGIDYMVRVGDKPSTVEMLKAMPLMDLHMEGVPVITLGDVADVFYTDNSGEIYTNVNGSLGVMLSIQKQTGYSTGEVSDRLLQRFEKLRQENPDLKIITLSDQGVYIDLVMDSIVNNILFGGFLAILILILFLKDIRPTLVIACSIPISLVTAVVCMYFSGVTLNIISLSGLALGIGMLVDNSIVVIENIYRLRAEGYSMKDAAIEGAREVAGAILASTLTTICVFLPIVFTEGITRQLFVDMGLTIAYSLLASLFIALTVVPAMASKMLNKTKEQYDGKLFGWMTRGYEKLLEASLGIKPIIFLLMLILLVGSVWAAFTNGTAFMSDMDSTQLTVSVQLEEGATLKDTAQVTDQVVQKILELDDVKDVGAMANTSTAMSLLGGSGSGSSTNATTIYVTTIEEKSMSNDEIADYILESTKDLEARISVETSSMDLSAMGGSGITIQVRGKELDEIQRIAGEVAAIVEQIEGTENVSDGREEAKEELRIVIDREKAVTYGLTVAQIYSQIYSRLAEATTATALVAVDKDYDVYVTSEADQQLTRELIKDMEIKGTDKEGQSIKIPLRDIASFEKAKALSAINRVDQTRYLSVTASIAEGYNVGLVSADVEDVLDDYQLADGYKLVFSGENEM
ncbi:MAG: efflux RND transporter permease subunit, partial [Lachnospiraceae bacterium]|nr:efflux RND transporter permease subunit [Lachnospiraceae bacterium]